MSQFLIHGGVSLNGEVTVSGMKNAATAIIAATLLTKDECRLHNVPRIADVERMLDILKSLGAKVEWVGKNSVSIICADVRQVLLPKEAIKSMRSSVLLLGPLLARFKEIDLPEPGGDIIGNRSLDTHLVALAALGAEVHKYNGSYKLRAKKLRGAYIVLSEFSVTATENALMTAVLSEGETEIKIAAAEPHVQDLSGFLRAMGADIAGDGTHTLRAKGKRSLHGAEYTIISDVIEAGTFIVAALLTKGEVEVKGVNPNHADIVWTLLKSIGAKLEVKNDAVKVSPLQKILRPLKLQTLPYPGFPTDLQAPFGVLATQCQGASLIHDPMYEGRLGYINELIKMGANAVICDPHRVLITGPTPLCGREITSFDLRAGATLILAGLIAEGETLIHDAQIVDRGYERIEEKLSALGANIKRI